MANVWDNTANAPSVPQMDTPFDIDVANTTGLSLAVGAGVTIAAGSTAPVTVDATTLVLTDNAVNVISINLTAGTVVNDGVAVVAPHLPIYTVVTAAGAIISVTDLRIAYYPGQPATVAATGGSFTGLVNLAAGADIASAATVDLAASTGNSPRITGTVATSAVTMNTGQWELVTADGAWPLTYHATTNKITGGVNTTLAAGDQVLYHKDLSGVVSGIILRANPDRTKTIRATRDLTAATGSVAYTGFGGKPKFLSISGCIDSTKVISIGQSDGTANTLTAQIYDGTTYTDATRCIMVYQAGGAYQLFVVTSLDADGFTGTWTKTGVPTGTFAFDITAELE